VDGPRAPRDARSWNCLRAHCVIALSCRACCSRFSMAPNLSAYTEPTIAIGTSVRHWVLRLVLSREGVCRSRCMQVQGSSVVIYPL
jgi:hypothetical protein